MGPMAVLRVVPGRGGGFQKRMHSPQRHCAEALTKPMHGRQTLGIVARRLGWTCRPLFGLPTALQLRR